jgi:mannose-6-phosphate isomerase-like protein (cupin superfamily)
MTFRKELKMKSKSPKAISITFMMTGIIGGILMQGCAMKKEYSVIPSKVLIMDLNSSPEYQELLNGKPQTCGMRSGRVYLNPGETCGQHSTEAHEELLVFLSGRGVALIGEEQTPHEVGAGKVCYIPPFTTHNNKNTGAEPLVYVYCVTPVSGIDEKQLSSTQDNHKEH